MIGFWLAAFVFLIPSNWFLQIAPQTAYVRGLQLDYLIGRISVQSVALLLLAASLAWQLHQDKQLIPAIRTALEQRVTQFVLLLIGVLVVRQGFSDYPIAGWSSVFELLLMLLVGWLGSRKESTGFHRVLTSPLMFYSLLVTVLFQSSLALYQFFAQQSLLGYWFLGESTLSSFAGLLEVSWGGGLRVAPLGTTAHANILAGVIVVYLLLLWRFWIGRSIKLSFVANSTLGITTLTALFALFLTHSLAAWLALALGGVFFLIPRAEKIGKLLALMSLTIFLLAPVGMQRAARVWPEQESIARRAYLNTAGWQMWLHHPIWGVGAAQSTAHVETYSPVREVVRFTQPPHHFGLVLLSELGIVGVGILGAMLVLLLRRGWSAPLAALSCALLVLGSFDHYVITISTGRMLLILIFAFAPAMMLRPSKSAGKSSN